MAGRTLPFLGKPRQGWQEPHLLKAQPHSIDLSCHPPPPALSTPSFYGRVLFFFATAPSLPLSTCRRRPSPSHSRKTGVSRVRVVSSPTAYFVAEFVARAAPLFNHSLIVTVRDEDAVRGALLAIDVRLCRAPPPRHDPTPPRSAPFTLRIRAPETSPTPGGPVRVARARPSPFTSKGPRWRQSLRGLPRQHIKGPTYTPKTTMSRAEVTY